jgi:hypothetical protein
MALFRATFSGALASSEIFAYSFCFTADDADPAAHTVHCDTWLKDLWNNTLFSNHFNVGVIHNRIRVSRLNIASGQVEASADLSVSGTGYVGTSSQAFLPFEVAVCVSLRTALAGRRHRGRFYLPPPIVGDVPAAENGKFQLGLQQNIADRVQVAFNNFRVPANYVPVVFSKAGGSTTPINGIDVGNIPDAQRRRRNKMVETRVFRTIP